MKRILLVSTAAIALAGPAAAQSYGSLGGYTGATLDGTFWYHPNSGSPFTTHTVRATAQFAMFGPMVFLQPEISLYDYNFTSTGGSVGGHLGYQLTSNIALGFFLTANAWFPVTSVDYAFGAEVKGTSGKITYEAYAGAIADSTSGIHTAIARGDLWYAAAPKFEVGAGLNFQGYTGGTSMTQATIRACYEISDKTSVEGSYTYTQVSGGFTDHSFGVKFTTNFDDGTTFSNRDLVGLRFGF